MFGIGKGKDARVEAIREQLVSADLHARTVLTDAMTQMESRLSTDIEQRDRLQVSTEATIAALRDSVASSSNDVARALDQVASICALVADRLEDDRLERRALTEALAQLARLPEPAADLPAPAVDAPGRIVGGTFFGTPAIVQDTEISVVDDISVVDAETPDDEHTTADDGPADNGPADDGAAASDEPVASPAPAAELGAVDLDLAGAEADEAATDNEHGMHTNGDRYVTVPNGSTRYAARIPAGVASRWTRSVSESAYARSVLDRLTEVVQRRRSRDNRR